VDADTFYYTRVEENAWGGDGVRVLEPQKLLWDIHLDVWYGPAAEDRGLRLVVEKL
jgi:hypothetical protein